MINKEQIVGAIDIGTTKIVTIIGKKNENGRLDVLAMAKTESKGVKRGVVQNIEETVAAINKTVAEAEQKAGVKITEVFVGIAGQHIRSIKNRGYINRNSYDDEITKEDIKALENDMRRIPIDIGEEIIHVIPQSYIVDNEPGVKNPVGMSGKRVEANFHIVIAQIASAKNIEKCVQRVGLKVKSLMLEPLASAEAVLTDDEKEAGVVLVDIGGGTTDIAVYYDDIIRHTAVIPFGGNVITKDIKEGCAILQRQAEQLKTQFGSALGDLAEQDKVVSIAGISGRDAKEISFKSLAYIIQSRMEEIFDAVTFEIENSGYAEKLSAGIVLTGGGALLKHLPQLVKFKTGMDVRVGFPSEQLSAGISSEINQPMYSTAIGLVLKGFEYMDDRNEVSITRPIFEEIKTEPVVDKTEEIDEEEEVMAESKPVGRNTVTKTISNNSGKPSFLDSMRKTFGELFEENDVKM
jgi:cell division protein FtsA